MESCTSCLVTITPTSLPGSREGGNQTCRIQFILARAVLSLVTPATTRCRGGSSPIASALACFACCHLALVSLSHHACTREEALKSDSPSHPSSHPRRQITGLASCRRCCPMSLLANPLPHHSLLPQRCSCPPRVLGAVRCSNKKKDLDVPWLTLVLPSKPTPPLLPLSLRHYVSHHRDYQEQSSDSPGRRATAGNKIGTVP